MSFSFEHQTEKPTFRTSAFAWGGQDSSLRNHLVLLTAKEPESLGDILVKVVKVGQKKLLVDSRLFNDHSSDLASVIFTDITHNCLVDCIADQVFELGGVLNSLELAHVKVRHLDHGERHLVVGHWHWHGSHVHLLLLHLLLMSLGLLLLALLTVVATTSSTALIVSAATSVVVSAALVVVATEVLALVVLATLTTVVVVVVVVLLVGGVVAITLGLVIVLLGVVWPVLIIL